MRKEFYGGDSQAMAARSAVTRGSSPMAGCSVKRTAGLGRLQLREQGRKVVRGRACLYPKTIRYDADMLRALRYQL